ncbi:hypothetical protein ONZ45_g9917 [Pleurotus djamor]|nr:hypothetical protein ONZ45_g9917 [Pleurotus djamor]
MPDALPAISFVCTAFFAFFLCADRVRVNIPNCSLITWLFVCNLLHGINSIIWSGNVDVRVPVWCDITTRLLLGANVGLPTAFICIASRLERISSQREISNDHHKRSQNIFELALCIVMPMIYMALHYVAQDRRFDLVQDYGCFASFHPSSPALIIVWLPPLLTCSIAILFCAITIHNSFRLSTSTFSSHVISRSTYTSSIFIRTLIISLITSAVLALSTLFALFSPPRLSDWTSWEAVHAHFYDVDIIVTKNELTSIQFAWWGFKAVSIVYLVLSLAMGEEIRDGFKCIRKLVIKHSTRRKRKSVPPVLVLHTQQTKMVTTCESSSGLSSQPVTLELKSGWDDMLNAKLPKHHSKNRSKLTLSPRSRSPASSPSMSPCASPTPSSAPSSSSPEDDSFAVDTLNYLNTPVAQSLGLKSPPPVYTSPQKATYNVTPAWRRPATSPLERPASPKDVDAMIAQVKMHAPTRQSIPEDAASTVSSLWEAPWPEPPSSAPPGSPAPSSLIQSMFHHRSASRSQAPSRCPSPALSDTLGLPVLPAAAPVSKPFSGPTVGAVRDDSHLAYPPRRSSLRKLGSMEGIGITGMGRGSGSRPMKETIYMTVVQETA